MVAASLTVLAALIAAAIAVRSPFHALCVFIATLPFEYALTYRGTVTVTPANVAFPFLLAIVFVHRRDPAIAGSLRSPVNAFVLAYLAVATLSLVMTILAPAPVSRATSELLRWRVSEYRSVFQVMLLFFSTSAFFATIYFCSTEQRLRMATRTFVVVVGLTGLYGLFQTAGVRYRVPFLGYTARGLYDTPASLRANATFLEPMNFGHFLVAGLPILLALYLHHRRLSGSDRRVYGPVAAPMIAVMSIALFLTIGRAAWLGGVAACLVVVAASDRLARRRAAVLVAIGVAVTIPVVIYSFGSPEIAIATVRNRLQFGGVSLQSEQRLWYFPFLLGLFRQHPILGVGYGNYPLYQVLAFDLYGIAGAYGVFWQALVETGILGFTSLISLVVAMAWYLVRALRATPNSVWQPYLVGWLGVLAGLMVPYLFFGDRLSSYVWVAFGLAMSTVRLARRDVVSA